MSRANGLTRQEILTAIKCHGSLTAETIAQQLHISPVAVRQHLSALAAEGSVTIQIVRRGLGRPAHYYRLTEAGDEQFTRRYMHMAVSLIEELSAWQGEDAVHALLALKHERELPVLRERLAGLEGAACLEEWPASRARAVTWRTVGKAKRQASICSSSTTARCAVWRAAFPRFAATARC